MKDITTYILEAAQFKVDRKDFEEKCPKFWQAVSQFCRDKNSEEGIDYLIAAWISPSSEEFEKAFPNPPFNANECHEFEWDFLSDEAIEEVEKYAKNISR